MTLSEQRAILAEFGLHRKTPRIYATATLGEWDRNPQLRAEFGTLGCYKAWLQFGKSSLIVGGVMIC